MDSAISPQCVGQEFVRQYYTMLHKAPQFMHRFYSHDSSFVHGGIEKPGEELPPIRGQMEIHKKILSLEFKDCHAKIRQVDSQASIDSAVVVQVAGELSNSGQPMRRFMQTFVLAPQSPKKYYVYNDIFRYQDEVFHDYENEIDGETESADVYQFTAGPAPVAAVPQPAAAAASELVGNTSSNNSVAMSEVAVPIVSSGSETSFTPRDTVSTPSSVTLPQVDASSTLPDTLASIQLSATAEPAAEVAEPAVIQQSPRPTGGIITPQAPVTPQAARSAGPASPRPPSSTPQDVQESIAPQSAGESAKPTTVGTMSWAALAGKNASGAGSTVVVTPAAPAATPVTPTPKPQATVKPELKPDTGANANNNLQPPRGPRPVERGSMERDMNNGGGNVSDFDDSTRRATYPDEQQLFVGNLPHATSNEELKEFFSQYGPVLDVRINRKGPSRDVPNFGFVTFESTEIVQKVLLNKPLYLGNKHRLNIEEKKPPTDLSGGPGMNRAGARGEPQRGGFKGGYPSGGRGTSGGVVSYRGGRGTWRGRPRGSGFGAGSGYRSQNEDNGSGVEGSDMYSNQN